MDTEDKDANAAAITFKRRKKEGKGFKRIVYTGDIDEATRD